MTGSVSIIPRSPATAWLPTVHNSPPSGRQHAQRSQTGAERLRQLMDSVIRAGSHRRRTTRRDRGLEWVLIDTRQSDPGSYLIREWTDALGDPRPVERPPSPRRGGAIGLFTLQDGCVSVGPCPPMVDEGAGLLLVGFTTMMALPLSPDGAGVFDANWLLILSHRRQSVSDSEIRNLLLLTWCIVEGKGAIPGERRTHVDSQHPAASGSRQIA